MKITVNNQEVEAYKLIMRKNFVEDIASDKKTLK
ncbi:hypothetical protein SAMN05421544_105115 [Riemerella columbipharyngis]|uniref:Uncharacterized protein n=1 Tax=Riemerella columbipharyngis TaxID=1071918 RepID=A0A1G7BCL8_9FLAO|nr:hypothetical protein SAMN05421544_105115 [Riemerella columbipharyngis]